MKDEKIIYVETRQVAESLWKKIGIETNPEGSTPEEVHAYQREKVNTMFTQPMYFPDSTKKAESNYSQPGITPIIDHERPLSNTIEALVKDIQSCNDVTTIDSYRILVKTKPELQEAFEKRRAELVKLESKAIIAAADSYIKK